MGLFPVAAGGGKSVKRLSLCPGSPGDCHPFRKGPASGVLQIHSRLFQCHHRGERLDSYYIPTRYPDGLVGREIPAEYYSAEDADACIKYAALILEKVTEFMKS